MSVAGRLAGRRGRRSGPAASAPSSEPQGAEFPHPAPSDIDRRGSIHHREVRADGSVIEEWLYNLADEEDEKRWVTIPPELLAIDRRHEQAKRRARLAEIRRQTGEPECWLDEQRIDAIERGEY